MGLAKPASSLNKRTVTKEKPFVSSKERGQRKPPQKQLPRSWKTPKITTQEYPLPHYFNVGMVKKRKMWNKKNITYMSLGHKVTNFDTPGPKMDNITPLTLIQGTRKLLICTNSTTLCS